MSLFTKVVAKIPRRNAFNLSHENHLTANMGQLIPTLVQECYPGDKFRIKTEASIKLAPIVFPVMGRIDVYFHTFFVPNRLLYANWEKFITGGEDGTFPNGGEQNDAQGNPVYVAPYTTIDALTAQATDLLKDGTLADYLGLPTLPYQAGQTWSNTPPISLLPVAAYLKIYADWYKDELLESTLNPQPLGDGLISSPADLNYLFALRYRYWHKDYFTSARPDTQLGPQVEIPLTGNIASDGPFRFATSGTISTNRYLASKASDQEDVGGAKFQTVYASLDSTGTFTDGNRLSYGDGLTLDYAGMLVNELRRSLKLQEWQEKNMRGGNRYIENIFHHFGVKSSDARLQRSQYLGGKKFPVVVGEIPQSVDTLGDAGFSAGERALGSRGGIANAAGSSKYVEYFCEEHGWIITLMSIMPHASYQQGIPRYFGNRWDRFEYLWPEFGNLGEQEVYNWELYLSRGANQPNDGTFGYQSRYADLKYTPNQIHGEFRGNTFPDMAKWHTGRIFNGRPQLNQAFCKFPTSADAGGQNRFFVVPSNANASHFYCHLFNHVKVLRMLPKYGVPAI